MANTISLQTREYNYLFPLYLYPNSGGVMHTLIDPELDNGGVRGRRPNLSPAFVSDLASCLGMVWISNGKGDCEGTFGPEDVFAYLYAIFHAPSYRERYAESPKR